MASEASLGAAGVVSPRELLVDGAPAGEVGVGLRAEAGLAEAPLEGEAKLAHERLDQAVFEQVGLTAPMAATL